MAIKVLDYNGLKQLTSKFKDYVNKTTSGKANTSDLNRLISNLKVQDTRNTNENPSYYIKNKSKEVVKELKIQKAIGVDSNSDSCLLVTMFPWQDNTAGYPVQLVFLTKSDAIYTRRGTGDTAWGKWRKILDDTDLKTKLSQLSEDSTHRLVTDAEKAKWNNKAEVSYVDSTKASVEKNTRVLTDGLSKDLKENVARLNNNKADKTQLNNYVTKVSGKGLSTNDFSNDYKARFDRDVRTDAQVMQLALKVSRRNKLFGSNELYKDLNNYYGTSISSSIRTLSQFQQSPSAMAQLLNNEVAKREMNGDLAYSRAIFEACMPYFKNNLALFKENFNDELKAKAMLTSPKCINEIINDNGLLAASVDKNLSTIYYTQFCPYVFSITNEKYNIALLSGPTALSTNGLLGMYHETLDDIMILGTYDMGSSVFQDALKNIGDRLGNSINLTYDDYEKRKKQKDSGDDWSSYEYSSNNNAPFLQSFYNFVKVNGFVKAGFNKSAQYSFSFSFLNLNMLKRDLARGL